MSVALDPDKLFFPDTASRPGRHVAVSPANSDLEHLCYGRIRLRAEQGREATLAFSTEDRETGLLCLKGSCWVAIDGADRGTRRAHVQLGTYDGLYVPRGSHVELGTASEVDLVECAARVAGDYPLQIVRRDEALRTPALHFATGGDASRRTLNIVIGDNVEAGRILMGFTHSEPGNWTSWPPHEHGAMLEEVYVYFDMPPPAFGIQLVYESPEQPELVRLVRDGDAVLMPGGYHPNVAAPGHPINFVWMMAARREVQDRQFGVVNVQPGFGQGSGLEASRDRRLRLLPGRG
jgi:5-deoxy-glucuronate isomerase